MKIYSYYQSIPTISQDEEFACANLWKASWTHYGWEPVMLNRSHAQVSQRYNKMLQKLVGELRHVEALRNQFDFIVARFIRWCALHASGGGWMSDYDVLNVGFTPESAIKLQQPIVLSSSRPCLFYVSAENAQYVINKYLSGDLVECSKIRSESDILGVKPIEIDGIDHVRARPGETSKSSVMQEHWALNLSQPAD